MWVHCVFDPLHLFIITFLFAMCVYGVYQRNQLIGRGLHCGVNFFSSSYCISASNFGWRKFLSAHLKIEILILEYACWISSKLHKISLAHRNINFMFYRAPSINFINLELFMCIHKSKNSKIESQTMRRSKNFLPFNSGSIDTQYIPERAKKKCT